MDFRVNKVAADKQPASCIVVGIYESHRLSPAARTINEASGGELLKLVRRFEIQGSVGDALTLNNLPDIKAPRVLLVGESWLSLGIHVKGFNQFPTSFYEEGNRFLFESIRRID